MKSFVVVLSIILIISCQSSDSKKYSNNDKITDIIENRSITHIEDDVINEEIENIDNLIEETTPKGKKEVKNVIPIENLPVAKKSKKEKAKVILNEPYEPEAQEEIPVKQPVLSKKEKAVIEIPFHDEWNTLTGKHISSSGVVNYKGFKTDIVSLESYTMKLSNNPPLDSWGRNEKLAYWINTYNAFTIKLIVDNYPVSSITHLNDGKPWDKIWISIGDKVYSLNQIENSIIRPQFNEPRIHFAVNCAAKSCPSILNRAWTKENLNSMLKRQTISFVNNYINNTIATDKAEISKIFEWYASDFGELIPFLNKYSPIQLIPTAKISYKEYDWSLNDE